MARVELQVVLEPNGPATVTALTSSVVLPVLVNVMVCAALVVRTFWLPKLRVLTLNASDVCTPNALSPMVAVPPAVATDSVPVAAPIAAAV